MKDLQLGQVHLAQLDESLYVGLIVAQKRRKVRICYEGR